MPCPETLRGEICAGCVQPRRVLHVDDAVLARVAARTVAGERHFLALLAAVTAGDITLRTIARCGAETVYQRQTGRTAAELLLVGDDEGEREPVGPAGFATAGLVAALRRCVATGIHAAAAEVQHYAVAAQLARMLAARVVMIETQPQQAEPWRAFLAQHAPHAPPVLITTHHHLDALMQGQRHVH